MLRALFRSSRLSLVDKDVCEPTAAPSLTHPLLPGIKFDCLSAFFINEHPLQ